MNKLLEKKLEETRYEITKAYDAVNAAYERCMAFVPSGDDKKDWQEAGKLLAVLSINTAVLRVPVEEACKQFIPELQGDEYQRSDPEKRLLMLLRHIM